VVDLLPESDVHEHDLDGWRRTATSLVRPAPDLPPIDVCESVQLDATRAIKNSACAYIPFCSTPGRSSA